MGGQSVICPSICLCMYSVGSFVTKYEFVYFLLKAKTRLILLECDLSIK